MNRKKIFFILISVLIVNVGFSQEKKGEWNTKLSLGTFLYTGNTEKFDFVSDYSLTRKDSLLESNLFLKGAYGEVEKVQNKQEFVGGLKFDYTPKSKFSPFILLSMYNNKFKDIELRFSSLLGAKYTFLNNANSDYSFSAALQYDTERYYESSPNKEKFRLSFRPRIKQKIGENAEFVFVSFYQPNVENFDDFMLVANASLTAKLFKNLAIKLSYNYDYESMPVLETIKKTDTSFITSVVINF